MDGMDNNERKDEIFSRAVRAGKRTYFFDVKSTRGNDYYLTITESKKRFNDDGKYFFEKHKLFLYKEDFIKFSEGLNEAIDFVRSEKGDFEEAGTEREETTQMVSETTNETVYTDVSFDDI